LLHRYNIPLEYIGNPRRKAFIQNLDTQSGKGAVKKVIRKKNNKKVVKIVKKQGIKKFTWVGLKL
jgi:hypothetical protein